MGTTEFRGPTVTKLERIAWLSAEDPKKEFHQLMHHFNKENLVQCFNELDGNKAVGADRINFINSQSCERTCLEPIALVAHDGF